MRRLLPLMLPTLVGCSSLNEKADLEQLFCFGFCALTHGRVSVVKESRAEKAGEGYERPDKGDPAKDRQRDQN